MLYMHTRSTIHATIPCHHGVGKPAYTTIPSNSLMDWIRSPLTTDNGARRSSVMERQGTLSTGNFASNRQRSSQHPISRHHLFHGFRVVLQLLPSHSLAAAATAFLVTRIERFADSH